MHSCKYQLTLKQKGIYIIRGTHLRIIFPVLKNFIKTHAEWLRLEDMNKNRQFDS